MDFSKYDSSLIGPAPALAGVQENRSLTLIHGLAGPEQQPVTAPMGNAGLCCRSRPQIRGDGYQDPSQAKGLPPTTVFFWEDMGKSNFGTGTSDGIEMAICLH